MEVKQRPYFKDTYEHMSLEMLYSNSNLALKRLDYILESIISTEAPITLNTLKERLRESFDVKKISQKALDIIMQELDKIGFPKSVELYDIVYWSLDGYYLPKFVRISNRQIYDIPKEEMALVMKNFIGLSEEEAYRNTLAFFGYETLTEKARAYLEYVFKYTKTL